VANRLRYALNGVGVPTALFKYGEVKPGDIWGCYDLYIVVMALGGAVRTICGLLSDKRFDPPVLVVDPLGRYVIPLSSSHWGANEAAREVAELIGAQPIITTVSEGLGIMSIEDFARSILSTVENPEMLPRIYSALIRGEDICVVGVSDVPWRNAKIGFTDCNYVIYVGEERPSLSNALWLRPMRLYVGVGAKRGADAGTIIDAVLGALRKLGVGPDRVEAIASIRDEAMRAAEALGVRFIRLRLEDLDSVNDRCVTPPSDQLRRLGIRGVAELAALKAAGSGARLILRKVGYGRTVTVAVAGR